MSTILALEALPEEVKSRKVNMLSTTRPMKYTAGCFAGLVYIVANDITELHKLYTYQRYNYVMWSSTLDSFFLFSVLLYPFLSPCKFFINFLSNR
jgi:hypothetical protein